METQLTPERGTAALSFRPMSILVKRSPISTTAELLFGYACTVIMHDNTHYSEILQIECLPYFDTWCGPSTNLKCRSEVCCARLAGNAGPKNRQKSPSGHHSTTLSGYIFASKVRIDNRKNLVKHQYLPHIFSQYGELRPSG